MNTKLALLSVFVGASVFANAEFVYFEADTLGAVSNGYMSPESSVLSFSSASGSLEVFNGLFASGDPTQCLVQFDSGEGSKLIINSSVDLEFLSFQYGNDDPSLVTAGDTAFAEYFDNGVSVGTRTSIMGNDDHINQTIGFSKVNTVFDRVEIVYRTQNAPFLAEVIDNICYSPEPVPEPATMAALGLGLAGIARRRRKA